MTRPILVALALTCFAPDATAGPLRRWFRQPVAHQSHQLPAYRVSPANGYQSTPAPSSFAYSSPIATGAEGDGLDEVNARRARSGLPPFIHDPGLAAGALACARFRAAHLMFGHSSNDFSFLPAGVVMRAAGCAAYHPSMGWYSCGVEGPYTHAGAAWVLGADGRRFMSLFLR